MNSKTIPELGAKSQASAELPPGEEYLLRLYVTGTTAKSVRAITNIKKICEGYLPGRYALEVIDVYQSPNLAKMEQILAVPTLVKCRPSPLKRWIGDLTSTDSILFGLNLLPEGYGGT